jgi:hypothetical protein
MSTIYASLTALAVLQDAGQGLSGAEVVRSLPRDPASIFALALVVAGCCAVIWFGRPRGGGDPGNPAI